eukprot:763943-Pyramimonas_sp.AAC.1
MVGSHAHEYWKLLKAPCGTPARRMRDVLRECAPLVHARIGPLQGTDEAKAWTTLLEDPPYNRDDARLMVDRCGDICARAWSQVRAHARDSIREWLRAALPRGAKK